MSEEYYDAEGKLCDPKKGYDPSPAFSLNNRLILEPRAGGKTLTATVSNGLAFIAQKETLVGLKILMNADINPGNSQTYRSVRKGDVAYIREEYFYTEEGSKKPFSCDAVEGKFIIVNIANVDFIQPK